MSDAAQVSYGLWNLGYRKLKASFTPEEAHERDGSGAEYCVLLGDPERPHVVVEVDEGRVSYLVVWLDTELREVLTYLFVPEDKNNRQDLTQRLFLEQVHFKEYDSPDQHPINAPRAGATFFKHDGSAWHTQDIGNGPEESRSGPMDPAEAERLLFEPHPTFGDWDSIARRDR